MIGVPADVDGTTGLIEHGAHDGSTGNLGLAIPKSFASSLVAARADTDCRVTLGIVPRDRMIL